MTVVPHFVPFIGNPNHIGGNPEPIYDTSYKTATSESIRIENNHLEKIKELEEENRKLKLHIEAKDKAYTALLKDYEELKEKNKNLKEKLEKQLGEMLFDVRS